MRVDRSRECSAGAGRPARWCQDSRDATATEFQERAQPDGQPHKPPHFPVLSIPKEIPMVRIQMSMHKLRISFAEQM